MGLWEGSRVYSCVQFTLFAESPCTLCVCVCVFLPPPPCSLHLPCSVGDTAILLAVRPECGVSFEFSSSFASPIIISNQWTISSWIRCLLFCSHRATVFPERWERQQSGQGLRSQPVLVSLSPSQMSILSGSRRRDRNWVSSFSHFFSQGWVMSFWVKWLLSFGQIKGRIKPSCFGFVLFWFGFPVVLPCHPQDQPTSHISDTKCVRFPLTLSNFDTNSLELVEFVRAPSHQTAPLLQTPVASPR